VTIFFPGNTVKSTSSSRKLVLAGKEKPTASNAALVTGINRYQFEVFS